MERDGSLKELAENISTTFEVTATVLSGVAKTVSVAYSAIKIVVGGVVNTFATASVASLKFAENVAAGMGKIGLSTQQLERRLHAMAKVAELTRRESLQRLGSDATDAGVKLGVLNSAIEETATTLERTSPRFNAVTGAVQGLGNELQLVPDYAGAAVTATAALAAEMEHAQSAVATATANLQEARSAIVRLAESNSTSTTAWRDAEAALKNAGNQLSEARAKVSDLSGETDRAAAATKALGDAFKALKITSQAELDAAAQAAETAFETIVQAAYAGQAAQEDVTRAFQAYAAAERARVAEGDERTRREVEQHLRIAASAAGLLSVYEQLGQKGEQAGAASADGFERAREKIDSAAESAERLGDAAGNAVAGLDAVANSASRAATEIQGAGTGLGFMSERALEALSAARGFAQINGVMSRYRDEIFATREELDAFTQAQVAAAEAAVEAADKLEELTNQLQRERDQATLTPAELERKRFEEQVEQIRQLEELSNGSAYQAAHRARALAEEEHRRRMAEIEEEARARAAAQAGETQSTNSNVRPSTNGTFNSGGLGGLQPAGDSYSHHREAPQINFNPTLNIAGMDLTNASERSKLARLLARDMHREMQEIIRRS